MQSTMIAGGILIVFNLISSVTVVLFTKKKPGRVAAKTETKFPYLTAAVNPDNVKSSKYPLEKYKSPGNQMSRAWLKKEAEFEAKKEAKEELGCAVDTDRSEQCHNLLQKHKEEKTSLEQNCQQLNNQLVLASDNFKELEGKYNERAAEQLQQIKSLQSSLTEMENAKKDELNSAEERLDAIQQEKYQQVLKIEELEQAKETVEQERDKLSLNKGKMESEIAGLKEHAQNLKDKISEKEETVENLISDMETQRKYHLDKDADLRNAQDRIKELEKKIANIEDGKSFRNCLRIRKYT